MAPFLFIKAKNELYKINAKNDYSEITYMQKNKKKYSIIINTYPLTR